MLADNVSDDLIFAVSPDSWLTSTASFGNRAVVVVAGDVWLVAWPNVSSWKYSSAVIKCT